MLFPAVRHELAFWHGGSRLIGDLVLPEQGAAHPVIIMLADAGDTQRDCSTWLDGLAAAGIASFSWDRPVPSEPAHDPQRRVAEHARQALAALDRLACLPELDVDAVALLGWGEGGWAATQAATFSDRIRALVLAGTPMAAAADLVEHQVIRRLRAAGRTGSDVAAAKESVRRRLAETGPNDFVPDPLPTLSAVGVPVLALFGEQDPTLPLEASVRGLLEVLRAAGHEDHRVAVVRGGDHALRVRPPHGLGQLSASGRHQFGEWPAGLTEMIVDWLVARIGSLPHVPAFVPPSSGAGWTDRSPGDAGVGHPSREGRQGGTLPVRQVRRRITH